MNIRLHLQIIGLLQILLALAHLTFPSRFKWKEDFSKVSLLNRQMFYVHAFFLCLTLVLFGLLNLACTDELLTGGRLSRLVLGGIATFWVIRWVFQFFVYDKRLWRGNRMNTVIHGFFALLWTYFAAGYTWAAVKGGAL
jgi:uncharacterized membrane protein YGL010W